MTMKEKVIKQEMNKGFDMEDVMRRSGHGCLAKEEKLDDSISEGASKEDPVAKVGRKRAYQEKEDLKSSLSEHNKDLSYTKQAVVAVNNQERSTMESDSKVSSSSRKEQDNWLESARAEMGEVREENQRLKMCLGQLMKDYEALQKKFYDIMQQEETKKSSTSTVDNNNHDQQDEEPEFISLSLGRFSSESKREEKRKFPFNQEKEDEKANNGGLSLGLEFKFEVPKSHEVNDQPLPSPRNYLSPVNNFEEPKDEAVETWPPNKVIKTMPNGEDEVVPQNPLKKTRVCVRARCDTPTMNDGCQWRKYGQKISKGNPCPRAYYRCTVAPSCPVRKQAQRCAEDMSILITTYEGTHNHPLPLSATAMASTTSAAASMLLSGSSSSSSTYRTGPNNLSSTTTPANLHGLNFYLSDSSNNSKQFYLHHNSSSSFSASPAHPTITLDLTSSNPSSHFNRFSSHPIPKIGPINSLNFTSSEAHAINWGTNGYFSYGNSTSQLPYNRAKPAMENNNHFQTYLQKKMTATTPDTIAAATQAITADPSFHSALAAALTSMIGSGSSSGGGGAGGDNFVQKLQWGESFPVAASTNYSLSSPTNKSNIACATNCLNKTTSANSQAANNLKFLPPSSILPFSSPKAKNESSSPGGDNRDHHAC